MLNKQLLKNGLEVYIEQKDLGYSCVAIGVNSGSFHDVVPETAHLLEHERGVQTKVYGEKGSLNYSDANATTQHFRTLYYFDDILPEHVPLVVSNLIKIFSPLNPNILEREKDAVRHELNPKINPLKELDEEVKNLAFPNFKKRMPSIKIRLESLEKINTGIANDYLRNNYDPANTFLFFGGDTSKFTEDILTKLEKIPSNNKKNPKPQFDKEPEIKDKIRIEKKIRNDNSTTLEILYQCPAFHKNQNLREYLALLFLRQNLTATHSALYRRMRDEKRLCYSLGINFFKYGEKAQFAFNTRTQRDLIDDVEKEWINVLKEISKNGIPFEDIEIIRNAQKVDMLKIRRDYDLDGLLQELDDDVTREELVNESELLTPEDIALAAKKFVDKPYIISIALPKD